MFYYNDLQATLTLSLVRAGSGPCFTVPVSYHVIVNTYIMQFQFSTDMVTVILDPIGFHNTKIFRDVRQSPEAQEDPPIV